MEFPRTVGAVQRAVQSAAAHGMRVKAVGAGHSFTGIAVAPGLLLDLTDLSGLVSVDTARRQATLLAGTRLHRIPALLAPFGLAMQNLGDIDRQSIAGAISTGTHGTGGRFGGLATQVVGVRMVTAAGDLMTVSDSENAELLPAVALSLGALGILVEVTLQCVPAFVLHAIEQPEPLDGLLDHLDERAENADHLDVYWFPHTDRVLTKTNTRLPENTVRHPIPPVSRWVDDTVLAGGLHQAACLVGAAVPAVVPPVNRLAGRLWGNREFSDASARVFASPRTVRFRETEYALPRENLRPAFDELRALIAERGWRISFPVELRFAAADDLWMSTAHGRATGYIAMHRFWREDPTDYFEGAESIMLAHGGRPHWGKMHSLDAATLRERYPRFDDFTALRDRLDPDRMFQNLYLERVLGP